MYLRILKKDLKRKKTMNVILLLFIILATTFVTSSVNNIVTVTNALDYYFDKAGVTDYFAATMNKSGEGHISEVLDAIPAIQSYGIEDVFYVMPAHIFVDGQNEIIQNTSALMSFTDAKLNYFEKDNQRLEEVAEGTAFVSGKVLAQNNIAIGDTVEIRQDDVSLSLQIVGTCKDASLGSDMIGLNRFIVSETDFRKFADNETLSALYGGSLCYINTGDTEAVQKALGKNDSIIFGGDRNWLKSIYVMDMIIAGILLVVSVSLILVAFVVLRFTITFTLTEEYREIGVMKAIGIGDAKIRSLYLVKYLMLAVIGTVIGFFTGIPLGNMLIASVSESMVLGNDNPILINVICSIGIITVILLFCFGCTGKIKRFSPIDAIRNGTTGERFRQKGILRLKNASLRPSAFLAANDVLSSPKQFATVILTYTLCMSLLLILVNTVNTLKSGDLVYAFGITETDAYYVSDADAMSMLSADGRKITEDKLEEIETVLAENGIPAKCAIEVLFPLNLISGENSCKAQAYQGIGTTADMYRYFEGTPPQNANEIAITPLTAEKLGATIGDTVTIQHTSGDREYVITAFFQSMSNMGECVRLHENAETDFLQANGFLSFQIDFEDHPDEQEIRQRIERMKEIFHTEKIRTASEYAENAVGVAGILDRVKLLVLFLVMIVIMLITVLTERSFITKERGEIALLKAVGFNNGAIISWHTHRFGIVGLIASAIALIFTKPLTRLSIDPVFQMMGANYGVTYRIIPLEVYVIFPLIVLAVTILSGFFTALCTRTIAAAEASSIE